MARYSHCEKRFMTATGANSKQDGKRRIALVIGNGAYKHAGKLTNPSNDARAMAAALTRLGFTVHRGLDLGRDRMEDQLGEFEAVINGADAALLFYAGHGLQVKGQNYLVPVDADIRQETHLKRRAFALDDILEIMAVRARNSLIFLDACRDNPFARSLLAGLPEAEQKRYVIRSGLAEVKAQGGSYIAFATAPNNVALDGAGSNSPFTEALLAHIETPDQFVGVMMIDVRRQVLKATGNRQEPWCQSALREPFCFNAVEPPKVEPPSPPGSGSTQPPSKPPNTLPWEIFAAGAGVLAVAAIIALTPHPRPDCSTEDWTSIKNSRSVTVLRNFAAACKKTAAGARAEARAKELELAASNDAEQRRKREAEAAAQAEAVRKRKAEAAARRAAEEARRAGKLRVAVGRNEERWLTPGKGKDEFFKDCENCPEMVVVPGESFTMGSPAEEPGRGDDEGPQHNKVTIAKPFAVGRFAVTFAEWDACVADGGCDGYKPSDAGWGRGDRPVINVSWDDAQSYVKWLSRKTGKSYRLPSEAEREYFTRARTTTPFWWGKKITPDQANYNGDYVYAGGGSKGVWRQKTVPVKSFAPNPWGLYQVHGNVWEWTEDCWNANYEGAPSDGSAWTTGDCRSHVVRGGSWFDFPWLLRSASRFRYLTGVRGYDLGFRVARAFTP
jgi:formylglycine-generating enzyme required for sulfatase activity